MAEAILKSFDPSLEIYSGGIAPADHISPEAIEVLSEIGIKLAQSVPQHYTKFENMDFDFLITVGDGTNENLKIPPIKYKRKMHLGFQNPYTHFRDHNDLKEKCAEIRDEILIELRYFYDRIISKEKPEH